jgi:very-short-patch-repair endonuclease
LAERQHGLVARWQLVRGGIGRGAMEHRLKCGRLHSVHRGVYAVGHRVLSRDGWWLAAVLACGADAVLSHRSAAALWRIRPTERARADVTVPRAIGSCRSIQVHRTALAADEVTVVRGIPVTTVARTLLDLAAVVPPRHVERAINEAEVLRLGDERSLARLLERYPRRPGTRALRKAGSSALGSVTRSELEHAFRTFLDDHDLPSPIFNVQIEPVGEVDCLWHNHGLVVELDGRATHDTRAAFERDRERDRRLQALGHRVVRVTWRQLHTQPQALAHDLRALLQRAPDPPAC